MAKKLNIFLSYAHEDEEMKNDLDKHLIMLKRSGKVDIWQDNKIMAGSEWDEEIINSLKKADIILLLISVDFNNSNYIWEKELKIAMQRHEKNEARVIPIILRKCEWNEFPYAKLQALPTGANPISGYIDKDEAYTDVARNINNVVDYLINK